MNEVTPERLNPFLTGHFGPGETKLTRIGGGQSNPTFIVDHGDRRMVLRKQPAGEILKGAHAIDREFRVRRALQDTDVPVPRTLLFHADRALLGTPFYLMDFVEGRVFFDCRLPDLSPPDRRAVYLSFAQTLARMHRVRPDGIGLSDFGRPGGYFARQLKVYGRQGLPCERCARPIVREQFMNRSSHFCPGCQRRRRSTAQPSRSPG